MVSENIHSQTSLAWGSRAYWHLKGSIRTASANSVESDHGCTSRIYFDKAGDNVTLTSQKPCNHNNKCDRSKTNGYK